MTHDPQATFQLDDSGTCTAAHWQGRPLYQRATGPVVRAISGAGMTCTGMTHRVLERGDPLGGAVLEVEAQWEPAEGDHPGDNAIGGGVGFATELYPSAALGDTEVHLPKSIYTSRYHHALIELGESPDPTRDWHLGSPGQSGGPVVAHYLEPSGSDPSTLTTRHPLLLPVVAWHHPGVAPRAGVVRRARAAVADCLRGHRPQLAGVVLHHRADARRRRACEAQDLADAL